MLISPILCSEIQGRTLYRLLCGDAGGDTEGVLLNETVPPWVLDIVVDKTTPKPKNKVYFFLLPHASSGIKREKKYDKGFYIFLYMHTQSSPLNVHDAFQEIGHYMNWKFETYYM